MDIVGALRSAVEIERRLSAGRGGASKALRDVLGRCVTEYNKMTSNKRHRIDAARKTLSYNLSPGSSVPKKMVWLRLRAPLELGEILHFHYDKHRH